MIELIEQAGGIVFAVRVTPQSSRNSIDGEHNGAIKIRLTAPPVENRANDALRRFLAAAVGIPAASVTILSGKSSRTKRVRVSGIGRALLVSALRLTEEA